MNRPRLACLVGAACVWRALVVTLDELLCRKGLYPEVAATSRKAIGISGQESMPTMTSACRQS